CRCLGGGFADAARTWPPSRGGSSSRLAPTSDLEFDRPATIRDRRPELLTPSRWSFRTNPRHAPKSL
ncbi:hypothetical protein GGP41_008497, partial [Bipolaris sorokiniana]